MNANNASVAAYQRLKQLDSKKRGARSISVGFIALFFILLMGTLAVGANIYAMISADQAEGDSLRLQTGILASSLNARDAHDCVEVRQGPQGDALVITEKVSSSTFETRIYQYDGSVDIEYVVAGKEYSPQTATRLFDSNTFKVSVNGSLVSIVTDVGRSDIALRSHQGDAV